jgi:hypothetical protein
MSWALLEMALSVGAGFKGFSHAALETGRLANEAHNSQSKVNAAKLLAGKSGFFRPIDETVPENDIFGNGRACL